MTSTDRLPVLRSDCLPGGPNAARPCEHRACRFHLEPERLHRHGNARGAVASSETCTLDIADRDGVTLEEIAAAIGLKKEGARVILMRALRRFAEGLGRLLDADQQRQAPAGRRR